MPASLTGAVVQIPAALLVTQLSVSACGKTAEGPGAWARAAQSETWVEFLDSIFPVLVLLIATVLGESVDRRSLSPSLSVSFSLSLPPPPQPFVFLYLSSKI